MPTQRSHRRQLTRRAYEEILDRRRFLRRCIREGWLFTAEECVAERTRRGRQRRIPEQYLRRNIVRRPEYKARLIVPEEVRRALDYYTPDPLFCLAWWSRSNNFLNGKPPADVWGQAPEKVFEAAERCLPTRVYAALANRWDYSAEEALAWWEMPLSALGGLTPCDMWLTEQEAILQLARNSNLWSIATAV
jgi:hypothetical protein